MGHDPFYVMADFADYVRAQDAVSHAWSDQMHWQRMSVLNTARSGFFSSDRSIREYCKNIWNVDPLQLEITCDARSLHQKSPGLNTRAFLFRQLRTQLM